MNMVNIAFNKYAWYDFLVIIFIFMFSCGG